METNTTPTYTYELFDRDELELADWRKDYIHGEWNNYTVMPCPNPECEWGIKVWGDEVYDDHVCSECEDGAILMTWYV